jgi:hypothetical protein
VDVISSAVIECIRTGYLHDSDGRRFVFLRLLFHVLNNGAFQKLIFEDEVEDLTGDDEEKQMDDADDGSQPENADDGSQPGVADDDSQKGVDEDDVEETAIPKKKTAAGRKPNQTSTQSHLKQALKSIVPFGEFNFSGPANNTRNGGQSTPAVPKGAAAKTTKKPEKTTKKVKNSAVGAKVKTPALPKGKSSSSKDKPTVDSTRRSKRGSPAETDETPNSVNEAAEMRKVTDELRREQESMRRLQDEMKRDHEAIMKARKNQSSGSITL